jgi:O-antigen ligase
MNFIIFYKDIYNYAIFGIDLKEKSVMKKSVFEPVVSDNLGVAKLTFTDYVALCFFVCYVFVVFIQNFMSYTLSEPQWIYLSLVNLLANIYIFFNYKSFVAFGWKPFFKNKLVALYGLFLILSTISVLMAVNFDESLITLSRYFQIFIAFINLYILFANKNYLIKHLIFIVTLSLFLESLIAFVSFYKIFGENTIDNIRSLVKNNHSNRNIFSADILVKLPFVFYSFYVEKNWRKIISLLTITFSVIVLYILGTRALIIGLVIVSVFLSILMVHYLLKTSNKKMGISFVITIVLVIFSVFASKYLIQRSDSKFEKASDIVISEKNKKDRMSTVSVKDTSFNLRLHYWESSFKMMKEKPLLGCGVGNWKINSLKYEYPWRYNNSNGLHMHNDFLEVAAESGILCGLIYIGLFVLLAFINLKKYFSASITDEKFAAMTLFLAVVGLGVDSFFNFPLSRPTIQILFIILLLLTLLNHKKVDANVIEKQNYFSKYYSIIAVLTGIGMLYLNFLMFNFYKAINIVKIDLVATNEKADFIDGLFGDFPSIDDTASPVQDIKTRYYIKENQFEKAKKSIEESQKINPYSLYCVSQKVELFDAQKKYDSVLFYNKYLFERQPNYPLYYQRYIQSLARKKDTTSILNVYKQNANRNLGSTYYSYTFSYLLDAGYGAAKAFKIAEEGLKKYPSDPILLDIKKQFRYIVSNPNNINKEKNIQSTADKTLDFSKALAFYLEEHKNNPKNYVTTENLGICYYQQKNYNLAIKYLKEVIDAKAFKNGKSQYVAAASFYALGDTKQACEYGQQSLKFNYPDAKQLIVLSCK